MMSTKRLQRLTNPIVETGQCGIFLLRMLASIRPERELFISVLQQTYLIGARSLVIIMIIGYGIIDVPNGIVTAELTQAYKRNISTQACRQCSAEGHDPDAKHCKYCGAEL